jgi:probable rRNA maturation factor
LPDEEVLPEIEFILVDRATMARVHGDFLGDPTETDVITFPYGEILVCPAVAQDRAVEFGHDLQTEVLLYCLHGLLHLAGYDDTKQKLALEMEKAQAELLRKVTGPID